VLRQRETEVNNKQDKDNGILLSVVLDGPVSRSYLLTLDPKTMTETGRAELDRVVGFGFHETHISYAGKSEPNGRSLDV
jgi:carotenoid cleavage dioxygenase-like enzyme